MSAQRRAVEAAEAAPFAWRSAAALVTSFWLLHLAYLSLRRVVAYPAEGLAGLVPRMIVDLTAILISLGLAALQFAIIRWPLPDRIAATVAAALLGAALHTLVNVSVFHIGFGMADPFELTDFLLAVQDWMWVYFALSAILLALTHNSELRQRERQLAAMAARAHAAQLSMLRHQLNPHFLFNTLNSIAALVRREQDDTAESMIENLSDFLRNGLALDPHEDIPLERELELQGLYLDIERLRFPDRLDPRIDIDERLRDVPVPALITQPAIENAIKYAVARSSVPVRIEVAAREENGMIELVVRDDGGDAPAAAEGGTHLGLANVEGRLRARFGDSYAFSAAPLADRGFEVRMTFPSRKER